MSLTYKKSVEFIRSIYGDGFIPLHEPRFAGNEKDYLCDCIDTGFVSSVGKYVDLLELKISDYMEAESGVATVNGTAALHVALKLCDVQVGDEILTQPLTFIATCNAISYTGAKPVFVDVDIDTMGMSSEKLQYFLNKNTILKPDGYTYNKLTSNRIKACVPMHTFGHPCRIDEIVEICNNYTIEVVEDAAESIGSTYKGKHTGLFGKAGVLSFNGNKTITTGGGGMIITNDSNFGKEAKHITTTAKIPHQWEFMHDRIGFNYRMPNINAALGCAQIENLNKLIYSKRKIAEKYMSFFDNQEEINFIKEPENARSNYWLNAIIFKSIQQRNDFLKYTNENGIMTRPIWKLMNNLDMYKNCFKADLSNSEWLVDRIVNIPSSANL